MQKKFILLGGLILLIFIVSGVYISSKTTTTKFGLFTTPSITPIPTISSILATITPTNSLTTDKAKILTYSFPSGWKVIRDKTETLEIGYDPDKGYVFDDQSIRDRGIGLTQKSGYGQYFSIRIAPYDGGSRHKFILDGNTLTDQDKMSYYHERNYVYNGWSCLVLYGVAISQWPTTEGMCALNQKSALHFGTWMGDKETEQIIQTIRILK